MNLSEALLQWGTKPSFGLKLRRLKIADKNYISEENYEYVSTFLNEYIPLENVLESSEDEGYLHLKGTEIARHVLHAAKMLESEGGATYSLTKVPYPQDGMVGKVLVKKADVDWIRAVYQYDKAQHFQIRKQYTMEKEEYKKELEEIISTQSAQMEMFLRGYVRVPITKKKLNGVHIFLDFLQHYGEEINGQSYSWINKITKLEGYTANERTELQRMVVKYLEKTKDCKITIDKAVKNLEDNKGAMKYEQFLLLEKLVFDEQYIRESGRWEYALRSRKAANTWLVTALHFTTEQRLGDLKNLRRPQNYVETDAEKLRIGTFSDQDAEKYCEDLEAQYRYLKINASKTRRFKNAPGLVFIVGMSYRSLIGRLICLCEMHYRREQCEGPFLGEMKSDVVFFKRLFTEKVLICLNYRSFQSRAVTKAYMNTMERVVDKKEGDGCGHLVNAILRSHIAGVRDYAKMIDAYLSDKMDRLDTAEAFLELFQRGCISCISVDIVKAVIGEEQWRELDVRAQTALVNSIHNTNLEIEQLAKLNNEIDKKVQKKKNMLIYELTEGDTSKWKKTAEKILEGIGNGNVSCKDDGCYCMLKAVGKPCVYPSKKNGIGCPYEMYTPAFLVDIAYEILDNRNRYLQTNIPGEKKKYKLYYSQVLKPLVDEFCRLACGIYGVDYRSLVGKIVSEGGKNSELANDKSR